MAASSQYHRGPPAAHSHYPALTADHEHLYADLASSWQTPPAISRTPASSVILQRLGPSPQRPFADHYFDYGDPSGYVNHAPQHQPAWSANYIRPGTQGWSDSFGDGSFALRAPAPQSNEQLLDQQQTASGGQHNAHSSGPEQPYRGAEHHLPEELSAAQHGPPFLPPMQAPNLAPVSRLLNYPPSDLHDNSSLAPAQVPVNWSAAPPADVAPHTSRRHGSHTGNAISSSLVSASQGPLTSPTWTMLNSNNTSPVYEQMPGVESGWAQVDTQPEHTKYMSQPPPLTAQVQRAVAAPRNSRKSVSRISAPRVPAAYVERQKKTKVSKRKKGLPEANRQLTHKIRKEKLTCIRCRFYKSGCDCGEICQKCLKVEGNARSFKLPCLRERLEDAILVRHCNGRSNQEEAEFLGYDWLPGCQLFDMEIMWNLPGSGPLAGAPPMRIAFRQFHPHRPLQDTAGSVWSNTEGQVKIVKQPPYAVYDTASLIPAFERYFSSLQPIIEGWIFERARHDEIAWLTYAEVVRMRAQRPAGNNNLLDLVMRIQCLSVVSQGYGTVSSNNIPGIQEYDYTKMGRSIYEAYDRNSRDRPLPGAINHQMDVAALKYLKKLERLCVKQLATQIFQSNLKPWYELFLALYVLYWNMEYIHRSAKKYMISKNGTAIETHVSSVVTSQIKKWDWAFKVLIHHWIAVLRGYLPFKLARENPEELRIKGHLDAEGFQYVMKVASIFDQLSVDQSTSPFVGYPSTHDSLSSEWLKALFKEAGA